MKAVQMTEQGGPEVLRLTELPVPAPGPATSTPSAAAPDRPAWQRNSVRSTSTPTSCDWPRAAEQQPGDACGVLHGLRAEGAQEEAQGGGRPHPAACPLGRASRLTPRPPPAASCPTRPHGSPQPPSPSRHDSGGDPRRPQAVLLRHRLVTHAVRAARPPGLGRAGTHPLTAATFPSPRKSSARSSTRASTPTTAGHQDNSRPSIGATPKCSSPGSPPRELFGLSLIHLDGGER
jgi:hypothetical protein